MSRQFVFANSDYVQFAPGAAATLDGRPMTFAVLWKVDAVRTNGLLRADNGSGSIVFGANPYADGTTYWSVNGFDQTMAYAANTWYLSAWTKGNGSVAVHGHQ